MGTLFLLVFEETALLGTHGTCLLSGLDGSTTGILRLADLRLSLTLSPPGITLHPHVIIVGKELE